MKKLILSLILSGFMVNIASMERAATVVMPNKAVLQERLRLATLGHLDEVAELSTTFADQSVRREEVGIIADMALIRYSARMMPASLRASAGTPEARMQAIWMRTVKQQLLEVLLQDHSVASAAAAIDVDKK